VAAGVLTERATHITMRSADVVLGATIPGRSLEASTHHALVVCLCGRGTVLVQATTALQSVWNGVKQFVHICLCPARARSSLLQAGAVALAVLQLQRLPRGCTTGSHPRTQHVLTRLQDSVLRTDRIAKTRQQCAAITCMDVARCRAAQPCVLLSQIAAALAWSACLALAWSVAVSTICCVCR
jgi:hypothetical protein